MVENAKEIIKILQNQGYTAYFAGGYVRDLLMGRPSDDIDIATNAPVETLIQLFPKTIPVGIAFGIIIVVHNGDHFEVARFRKDSGYLDGRRPVGIELAEPIEDAKRRDFTINGIFYDPIKEEFFDYVKGKEDIEKGVIRAIGNADERFNEDRLRMIRAVRYSTRFDFPIEEKTAAAIKSHAKELTKAVSPERIWQELEKISKFGHMQSALLLFFDLGLLKEIFPETTCFSKEDVEKRVEPLKRFPQSFSPIAEVVQLLGPLDEKAIKSLAERLKISNEELNTALFLEKFEKKPPITDFLWAHFYAHKYAALAIAIVEAKQGEHLKKEHTERQKRLEFWIDCLKNNTPLIKGSDLKNLGIAPGERMGMLLKLSMQIAIEERITDKNTLLNRLQKEL